MADSYIQLPGDSTGKQVDTRLVQNTLSTEVHREVHVVGDGFSSQGLATVTSSGGLAVTVTNPSTAVNVANTVVVTATQATNPWSSAPGFNIPVVNASSGLVQISGAISVATSTSAGVGSNVRALSSGTVTLSSAPNFNIPVVSVSSGLVQISGTATIVSASSGLVQISGTATVVSASSGLVQISGIPTVVVTTSGGLGASNIRALSSGTVTLSSNPTVIAASSGLTPVSVNFWQDSSGLTNKYIQATSIGNVSSNPCTVYYLNAISTTANTGGIMRLYNATTSNVVMNTSVVGSRLVGGQSSGATIPSFNGDPSNFSPIGMFFGTACSFDIVLTATSTATVAGQCFVSAIYSTK